jgi:hypothetical protein
MQAWISQNSDENNPRSTFGFILPEESCPFCLRALRRSATLLLPERQVNEENTDHRPCWPRHIR